MHVADHLVLTVTLITVRLVDRQADRRFACVLVNDLEGQREELCADALAGSARCKADADNAVARQAGSDNTGEEVAVHLVHIGVGFVVVDGNKL